MQFDNYDKCWNAIKDLMMAKMVSLAAILKSKINDEHLVVTDPEFMVDRTEFSVALDITLGNISIMQIDFDLLDAEENGADAGYGLQIGLGGYNALAMGNIGPRNYQYDYFITDIEQLKNRVDEFDEVAIADLIINQCINDESLLKEIQSHAEPEISGAIENAQLAFWSAIAEAFPECTSGDLAPEIVFQFENASKSAVDSWLKCNLPDADKAYWATNKLRELGLN